MWTLLLFSLFATCIVCKPGSAYPFKKVVVLMMENQSFDHVFGFVSGIGKLTGREGNYDRYGNFIRTSPGCKTNDPDHPHTFEAAVEMLYYPNSGITLQPPKGEGFVVANFADADIETERAYMQTYDDKISPLPATHTLAKNFIVCDRWFASLPGPTVPNRLFLHSASSGGYAGGAWVTGHEYPPPSLISIFEVLANNNKTWNIYSVDHSLQLPSQDYPFVKKHPENNKLGAWEFYQDLSLDQQADYSFIIPSAYISQHPGEGPNAMKAGDDFIRWVYETIRQNERAWHETLFIITYDEWGGWYDSVNPTMEVKAPLPVFGPKWPPGENPYFDFSRLGIRVPGILISAWFDHAVDSTVYEHSSVPATLKRLFDLNGPGPDGFLTVRDREANWVLANATLRSTPRTDLYWLH